MLKHIVMVNFKAEVGQHEQGELAKKVVETVKPAIRRTFPSSSLAR